MRHEKLIGNFENDPWAALLGGLPSCKRCRSFSLGLSVCRGGRCLAAMFWELAKVEDPGATLKFSEDYHASLFFRVQYLSEPRVLLFHYLQSNLLVFYWSMRRAVTWPGGAGERIWRPEFSFNQHYEYLSAVRTVPWLQRFLVPLIPGLWGMKSPASGCLLPAQASASLAASYTSVFLFRCVVAGPHHWCLFLDISGIQKGVAISIPVPSITFLEELHYTDILFQNKAPCFGGLG